MSKLNVNNKQIKKRGDRRARQNKSSGRSSASNTITSDLLQDATNSAIGDNQIVKTDFIQNSKSYLLTQSPPRNFRQMIFWSKSVFSFSASITNTGVNENNISFALSNANPPNLDFDQYCIYEVAACFSPALSTAPTTGYMGDLITAIDYDNLNTLGSEAVLDGYSTVNKHQIVCGKSLTRIIKPQVSSAVYYNGVTNAYAPMRVWVDKANTACPHYGLRTMTTSVSSANYTMEITLTFILGFRNTV